MRVDIFSDIHLDHWMIKVYSGRKTRAVLREFIRAGKSDADTVIFAGDAGNGYHYYETVVAVLKEEYSNVIATPGNHDFYTTQGYCADHYVEGMVNNISYAACPLWTNFRGKPQFGEIAEKYINDWKFIPELRSAGWNCTYNEYYKYRNRLLEIDAELIVTHFPAITKSIHSRYNGDPLNPYFCNDDEELFNTMKAKLWVHGHTHSQFDYTHNGTRVIANPIGYPYELHEELIGIPMKTVQI